MMKCKYVGIMMLLSLVLLSGCSDKKPVSETQSEEESVIRTQTDSESETAQEDSYSQISQETALQMMEVDDGHVIVDVRRQDEYDAGHIPGAILIPNESIGTEQPDELPDLNQIILIYCRSGNRSKQAAQKLFDMGYTNIYEFGGINTWTGQVVTTQEEQEQQPTDPF